MSRGLGWILVAIVLLGAAALGYRQGQRAAPHAALAPVERPLPHDDARHAPRAASPAPKMALPADIAELDGAEFVAAMPELERRARAGDESATRLLLRRLQDCVVYFPRPEEDVRREIDEQYERQLAIQKQYPSTDPRFVIDEGWRTARLKAASDARERCSRLTSRQIGSRFDWASLALSRHDRDAIVKEVLPQSFFPTDPERFRYADKLIALAQQESIELNRLVEAGDLDAMTSAANIYSREDFGRFGAADLPRAYAIAYAVSLAQDSDHQSQVEQVMKTIGPRLSAQQMDEARRLGQALYDRCCGTRAAAR